MLLPPFLLPHSSLPSFLSHTLFHFLSQSQSLLRFVRSLSHPFLLNSLSPPHPLTTCPCLTFCSLLSLSHFLKHAILYLLSIFYSSPINGYLYVNQAPALTSLALCTLSRFNQSASSQRLSGDIDGLPNIGTEARAENVRRCIFTPCHRFMHGFQKANTTLLCSTKSSSKTRPGYSSHQR